MFIHLFVLLLLIWSSADLVPRGFAMLHNRIAPVAPTVIAQTLRARRQLDERQAINHITTCGYIDGNPQSSRTADPGYDCRIDTARGLWGFCPNSVFSARDCGLAGYCIDKHSCTVGCGRLFDRMDVTTFSCEQSEFCSTVLLLNGPNQSYEYIACGKEGKIDTLLAVPNAVQASTTLRSSVTLSASQNSATSTDIQIPPSIVSSLNTLTGSPPASTPGLTAVPSGPKSANVGAIVGGAVAGLTVVCLTILGVLFIRRKHGSQRKDVQPPEYTYNDQSASTKDPVYGTYLSLNSQKRCHWDSSHGPVEMPGGYFVNNEPIELMADTRSTEDILRSRQ